MKKSTVSPTLSTIGLIMLFVLACGKTPTPTIDYSTMHVYSDQELQKLIDHATKIELVGDHIRRMTGNPSDSLVTVTTTQVYRIYVAVTDDNRLVTDTTTVAMEKRTGGGPIIITSSCEMTCTPVRPGEPCNVDGCMPTSKCGCTQGSCGNNCTTDVTCHQSKGGFSFGGAIIF